MPAAAVFMQSLQDVEILAVKRRGWQEVVSTCKLLELPSGRAGLLSLLLSTAKQASGGLTSLGAVLSRRQTDAGVPAVGLGVEREEVCAIDTRCRR